MGSNEPTLALDACPPSPESAVSKSYGLIARRAAVLQLGALSVGHAVVDSYGHTLLAPMFPLLKDRLELSLDQVGTLPIMMGLTASLAQPLIGWVTDRWPRLPAVALGPALAALFVGWVSFAETYLALAGCLFLAGIGIGAFHPQGASLASRAAAGRGLAMSAFTVGGNIGFGVAPLLGALYFRWFGLEHFYLASVPGVLFGWFMWRMLNRPNGSLLDRTHAERSSGLRRNDHFALALLTGTVAVRAAVQIAVSTFMAFLLRERIPSGSISEIDVAGLSLAMFLLATALSGPIGGHLSDRVGRRTVMIASLAVAPFVFTAALALPGYWLVLGLAAGGFVLMLPHPANVVMAQEYLPASSGVAASMITGLAWSLGQFVSWPLGMLAERIGVASALQWIFWMPLFGVLMVIPLRDPRSHAHDS